MSSIPHSSFTIKANGIARDIRTPVKVAIAFNPATQPHPEHKDYTAIWDTGATGTVITRKVADECGLKPFTVAPVRTAAGQHMSPVYLINVGLPNTVGITHVRATEGILSDGVDVLIGMDIITKGDFALTQHEGKSAFSFRCPSCEHIDFVKQTKEAKTYTAPVVAGRNSACPCGSGKKYKRCCGK